MAAVQEGESQGEQGGTSSNAASAATGGEVDQSGGHFQTMCNRMTPTAAAVTANSDELCSRNMVLSGFTLLQQHRNSSGTTEANLGHHLLVSAMDAFLEGGDDEEAGGLSDTQIQNLLTVCNTALEHPLLLYQGGPTYHMVSNAAIMLCHLLNGLHPIVVSASSQNQVRGERGPSGELLEVTLFDEVLETFLAVRKLLTAHRKKMPQRLRCHGIPRPSSLGRPLGLGQASSPFIELGETLMCSSRGCQGFVLMGCSPCVAAERARLAQRKQEEIMQGNGFTGDMEFNEFDKELQELGTEFNLDDDALLDVLSRIVST